MYTLGFIGCGNMARAIIKGALASGFAAPEQIIASSRSQETLDRAMETFGIHTNLDNCHIAQESQILVLAVKPQVLPEVLDCIKDYMNPDALVVSLAAGKSLDFVMEGLGTSRVVRFMPNVAAEVSASMTSVCFGPGCLGQDFETALALANSLGLSEVISERHMDAATAVVGCSPAYVAMLVEAMADAGVLDGMPRSQALRMAAQAVMGTAKVILETGDHPGTVKDRVCSPGGTTIAGLQVLEDRSFRGAVIDALHATVEKARSL